MKDLGKEIFFGAEMISVYGKLHRVTCIFSSWWLSFTTYSVAKLLFEDIGLDRTQELNLPWLPPNCDHYAKPLPKYDALKSFKNLPETNVKKPEKNLGDVYASYSAENSLHETGAKVTKALEMVRIQG